MHHTPTPVDDRARRITFVLIAAGAGTFLLSPWLPGGRALLQTASLILFTTGIFVTVRYMMTSFSYSILPRGQYLAGDGTVTAADVGSFHVRHLPPSSLDLVVRKSQGRRIGVIEARLSLEELAYFAPLPGEGGRKREAYRLYPNMRVYNYTVSYRPVAQYIAVFVDRADNAIGVILELDGDMVSYLADTAAKNGMK